MIRTKASFGSLETLETRTLFAAKILNLLSFTLKRFGISCRSPLEKR